MLLDAKWQKSNRPLRTYCLPSPSVHFTNSPNSNKASRSQLGNLPTVLLCYHYPNSLSRPRVRILTNIRLDHQWGTLIIFELLNYSVHQVCPDGYIHVRMQITDPNP